ncbi:hypothetical protein EDB89DRAFT_1081392 [Lactarius sanguifluus]|nr:hypothetical protein EDB89DRAFT_1081392 [Lactarius sanguifluus]
MRMSSSVSSLSLLMMHDGIMCVGIHAFLSKTFGVHVFARTPSFIPRNTSDGDTPTSRHRSASPIACGTLVQTFTVSSTTTHLPQSSPNAPIRSRTSHGYEFRKSQSPREEASAAHPSVVVPLHPR